MRGENTHPDSSAITLPGSLAQSNESAKQPIARKRKAIEAPDACVHFHQKSKVEGPQALAGLTSNMPGRVLFQPASGEAENTMATASGGPSNQRVDSTLTPIPPVYDPDMTNQLPNEETILTSCNLNYSDQDPWGYLTTFGLHSPDLNSGNDVTRLAPGGITREVVVPTAPQVESARQAKQQDFGTCWLECPWSSLLEKIVSVELGISQLSRSAKKNPLQQLSPESLDLLLEDFVEIKQSYLFLRKSQQDSNKPLSRR
ncbi:hypothetical protein EV426DRAFT_572380 [Tirmania nivea]|nr:hypothetical protein EV426DRAFT_572380 [Tirmania nivea]